MTHPWLAQYPAGVPAEIDTTACPTLVALMAHSFERHASRPAYRFMGQAFSFAHVEHLSRALAAWLLERGLVRGDRVALMMPNLPQYPVAVAAVLRAGLVVVHVDPLQVPHELEHQLRDSGARAIVVLENFANVLQQVLARVPTRTIVLAAQGDLLGFFKGAVVNHLVRRVSRRVPPFELPGAVRFNEAIGRGRSLAFTDPGVGPDDIALLQYTGGTTGTRKGAVLLHRNLVASVLQIEAWLRPALQLKPGSEQLVTACVMPLHHIFGFSVGMLLGLRLGGCSILIPDPRDVPALLRVLADHSFHCLPALPTLFHAIARHADFERVDWSALRVSISGGMALPPATAQLWQRRTGLRISHSYGLAETGPAACGASAGLDMAESDGSIGLPLPGTVIKVVGEDTRELPPDEPGEILLRGPQVMAGYWQRPEETARVTTADGFLRTGDIGTMDERGRFRLVDRKKDLIIVNGFSVYPNEVEDAIAAMPGVLEVAAVGVPDAGNGERIKVVVVKKDPAITEAQVRAHGEARLSSHKRPSVVEFRSELPKTALGKILRRDLRG
jgi:long-chain acyl-CoA synthetase